MATTIAISGKGGSGKTTLAAMVIRLLRGRSEKAILAVDADPNSCLGQIMGVEPTGTIAEIREKSTGNAVTDRVRSFEYNIQQAITEADGFDLLTMGRPEGPGCYCAANNILRTFMDRLSSSYGFVVIDNEAGMEHLSRRSTNNVDLLCIVTEPTAIGQATAKRISSLVKELPITVRRTGVIWNRTDETKQLDGIETLGCVPYDKALIEASMQGKSVFDLDQNCPAMLALSKIFERQLNLSKSTVQKG
jgi:CO dehydrogenase maturation factor